MKSEIGNQKAEGGIVQAPGMRHRVASTCEAGAGKTSETVIQKIFDELPVP